VLARGVTYDSCLESKTATMSHDESMKVKRKRRGFLVVTVFHE
jgi:hypothetical protein